MAARRFKPSVYSSSNGASNSSDRERFLADLEKRFSQLSEDKQERALKICDEVLAKHGLIVSEKSPIVKRSKQRAHQ